MFPEGSFLLKAATFKLKEISACSHKALPLIKKSIKERQHSEGSTNCQEILEKGLVYLTSEKQHTISFWKFDNIESSMNFMV